MDNKIYYTAVIDNIELKKKYRKKSLEIAAKVIFVNLAKDKEGGYKIKFSVVKHQNNQKFVYNFKGKKKLLDEPMEIILANGTKIIYEYTNKVEQI
jgi:hypothetical protein